MEKEDLVFLKQMVDSFEEAEPKLRKAFEKEDKEELVKLKKFMLNLQEKISEISR